MTQAADIWAAILAKLDDRVGPHGCATWFRPLAVLGCDDVVLRLEAPSGPATVIETDEKVALTDDLFEKLGRLLGDKAWKIESAS